MAKRQTDVARVIQRLDDTIAALEFARGEVLAVQAERLAPKARPTPTPKAARKPRVWPVEDAIHASRTPEAS